ncbi:hypothetical protein BCT27_12400 [Enterovibrio norvegicus]|nr:hypothetical protein BCT27_12400 [Enterovibrio norvegicus]
MGECALAVKSLHAIYMGISFAAATKGGDTRPDIAKNTPLLYPKPHAQAVMLRRFTGRSTGFDRN